MKAWSSLVAIAVLQGPAFAQQRLETPRSEPDRTELERTPIVGQRELPKVLYIVPWKKPTAPPLAARPAGGVLDEPPALVDRDVLRRQLRQQAQWRERQTTPPSNPPGEKP